MMARKKITAAQQFERGTDRSIPAQTAGDDHDYSSHCARSAISPDYVAEPDNLVLEHLRALRTDMAAMREDMHEVKSRLTSVERSMAAMHADKADVNDRYDRIVRRIERIERRLELTD